MTKAGPSWAPYADVSGWLRALAIAVAAGGFLAISGAFLDDSQPLVLRFAFWIPLMLVGGVWGAFCARLVFDRAGPAAPTWVRVVATALLLTAPFTAVVWLASRVAFGTRATPGELWRLFGVVLLIALVMTALNVLAARRSPARAPSPGTMAEPRFLARVPPRLRDAELWAVQSEDHYLRLHTARGQDLILLRLSDAVAELEGLDGAQVHRSWWVARSAIADVRRRDGRAVLTLKDGSEVPVSRTYAKLLRQRGWF